MIGIDTDGRGGSSVGSGGSSDGNVGNSVIRRGGMLGNAVFGSTVGTEGYAVSGSITVVGGAGN